jgi:hypothetical protein
MWSSWRNTSKLINADGSACVMLLIRQLFIIKTELY